LLEGENAEGENEQHRDEAHENAHGEVMDGKLIGLRESEEDQAARDE
jgi:hypothetical protein